jgi:ABC-type multidrug transport system fused ATPase/permease subunit
MIRYLRPHKKLILIGSIALTSSTVASVYFPKALGDFVDSFQSQQQQEQQQQHEEEYNTKSTTSEMLRKGAVIAGIFSVVGVSTYLRTSVMQKMAQRMSKNMRHDLYTNLISTKHISYFDKKTNSASLANRLTSDVEIISDFISKNSMTGMRALGEGVGGLGFLYVLSSHLTTVVFFQTWIPVMLVLGFVYSKHVKRLNKQYLQQLNNQAKISSERILNMKTMIYPFAKHEQTITDYRKNYLEPLYINGRKLAIANGVFDGLVYSGTYLSVLAMVIMGTLSIVDGTLGFTIGNLSSMLLYSVYVVQSFTTLSSVFSKYTQFKTALDRISELLQEENINQKKKSQIPLTTGDIVFQNVTFSYSGGYSTIFREFNLHINSGEIVIMLGKSGIGKSTITALLSQFYSLEDTSGKIFVSGIDLNTLDPVYLRRNYIAIVPQDSIMFHTTILDNITFATEESIDMDLVIKFAKMVNIHDFIMKDLTDGYNTIIGDKGLVLSGGQKQRLNICRTLYHYHKTDCKVYIFDESMSALDIQNEQIILEQIFQYCRQRKATCLFITHRVTDQITKAANVVYTLKSSGDGSLLLG